MKKLKKVLGWCLLPLVLVASGVIAEEHAESAKVTAVPVTDGIYMLMGKGGNIGISIGEDGTFAIDDEYPDMSAKVAAAIKQLAGGGIPKFLVNTHWHGDHAGGNTHFGKQGSIIVAHESVRDNLKVDKTIKLFNMHQPASPKEALPLVTFQKGMSLHLNGDDIRLLHVANAHTEGDAIVHFTKANVIHTGDTFFNGFYPFIDVDSGGGIAGMIAACNTVLALADDKTKIMPGHGPLASKAELVAFRDMMVTAQANIQALIDAGKNEAQVVAAKPLAALDKAWGDGFLSSDVWTKIVYSGMTR